MEKRPQHGDGQSGQEPNSKKRKSDVSASSSSKKKSDFKSVLVLRSGIDVFPENGQIPLPNNKGLTQLRNVSSGRFKTDVEFTNRMSSSDVEEVLKQNFPILEKYTSFSCASAADNRSKLEFHEDQQTTGVWSGADIKRHIRGNSALYILAEGAPEAGTACEGSERAANRCSGQLVLQKHGPSGVGSSLVGTRMLQTLAGKSHHSSLPKFPSTINQIGSGAHVSTSSATITDNYRSPNTELSRTDSQQGDCDKESNQKSLDRIPSIAHDLQSEVSTHGNGGINSVEKDLTPSIILNMSEEEFDSAIEDIQDDTGAVRMCLSSKAQQILKMSGEEFDSAMEDVNEVISGDSGAVKKVCPSSGSTRGGGEFSIILNQQLQNEEEDFVADFEDVRNVLLTVENCFTLTGVTPAYHREGCVLVMVRSASGTWLGSATYTYVNPNKKEELRKVVEDKNKWKEILDTMSNGQIGNLDQQEIPSGAVVHGKTRDSWSIKLLTLLIYQAAEVDGFDFLEVVFSTSAGRVTFNNYKDNAIRPEDVARAYGHAILGDFLENVNKRLSKEVGNEDNNETINWLELKKTMETEGNPPRTNDAQPAGHLPRNDSYSDYDADDETSPLPSPSDTEANVDEMHVSGYTDQVLVRKGSELLSSILRRNTEFIEELAHCLDHSLKGTCNWRHLASKLQVDVDYVKCLEEHNNCSPTIRLFELLADRKPDLTVKELKYMLLETRRNDLVSLLVTKGLRDAEKVVNVITSQSNEASPRAGLLDEIAFSLDVTSPVLSNWKTLAVRLGVSREICQEFELRSTDNPTCRLFEYLATACPQMTLTSLKEALYRIGRVDVVKSIHGEKLKDDMVLIDLVTPGSELLERLAQELDQEGSHYVNNWTHLASKLNVPDRVCRKFAHGKKGRKSPTKEVLEWVAVHFPERVLNDVAKALAEIQRNDAIKIISKHFPETVDLAFKGLDCSFPETLSKTDQTHQMAETGFIKKEQYSLPNQGEKESNYPHSMMPIKLAIS